MIEDDITVGDILDETRGLKDIAAAIETIGHLTQLQLLDCLRG